MNKELRNLIVQLVNLCRSQKVTFTLTGQESVALYMLLANIQEHLETVGAVGPTSNDQVES